MVYIHYLEAEGIWKYNDSSDDNRNNPSAKPGPKYPSNSRYISFHKFTFLGQQKAGENLVYILKAY